MSSAEHAPQNTNDDIELTSEQLPDRVKRALYNRMVVLPNHDRAKGAPGLYEVISTDQTYLVDLFEDVCECKDYHYNRAPNKKCKHIHRVEIAAGKKPIPPNANTDRIDPLLGSQF